ncbi:hypothetical protein MCAMS1_00246 [biofilm metagenome]
MFSILDDMRKRGLEPTLEKDGMVRIAYAPPKEYYNWLKCNKRYVVLEFRAEAIINQTLNEFSGQ